MINERLCWWVENTKSLNSNQSSFRRNKQTMDQLIRFTQEIGGAYQRKEHVIATFIDLKQAYDRVWRKGLLFKMQNMGISGHMYKFIKDSLCNRTIQTTYAGSSSKQKNPRRRSTTVLGLELYFVSDFH
jgi:hypothetical protein